MSIKYQSRRVLCLCSYIVMIFGGCDYSPSIPNSELKDHALPSSPRATVVKVVQMSMGKQEEVLAYFTGTADAMQIYRLACPEVFPGGVIGNNMGGLENLIKGLGWNLGVSSTSVTYDNMINEDHKKILRDAGWGRNPDILCKYNPGEVTLRKATYPSSEIKYFVAFKGRRDEDDKMILYNLGCEGAIRGMGLNMNDAVNLSFESIGLDYTVADKYDISCVTGAPTVDKLGCKDAVTGKSYYHGESYKTEDSRSTSVNTCQEGAFVRTSWTCKTGYTPAPGGCFAGCTAADGSVTPHNGTHHMSHTDVHGEGDFLCADGVFRLQQATRCDEGYTLAQKMCGKNCGEGQYAFGQEHRLDLDWGRGHGTGAFYCKSNGEWESRGKIECEQGYRPRADQQACEPIPPNWIKIHCTPQTGGFVELTFDGNGGEGSFAVKGPGLLDPLFHGVLWRYYPTFSAKLSGLAGPLTGVLNCNWADQNMSGYTCVDTRNGRSNWTGNCYRM